MSEGSRLSRWSQRKLAARRGEALPEADEKKPSGENTAPIPADDLPAQGEVMLTEADLPPIDELTAKSDFSVFMKKNVPEMLRQRALRKLWMSDPVFANLDGLNDYDDDFSVVSAMTMDDTIYKVGRGLLGDEPEQKPDAESPIQAKAPVVGSDAVAVPGDNDAPPAVDDSKTAQADAGEAPDGAGADAPSEKSDAGTSI